MARITRIDPCHPCDPCHPWPFLSLLPAATVLLVQDHAIGRAAVGEALDDAASHADLRVPARYAVLLGEDPHAARPVVDLEDAPAHGAVGVRDAAGNGD